MELFGVDLGYRSAELPGHATPMSGIGPGTAKFWPAEDGLCRVGKPDTRVCHALPVPADDTRDLPCAFVAS